MSGPRPALVAVAGWVWVALAAMQTAASAVFLVVAMTGPGSAFVLPAEIEAPPLAAAVLAWVGAHVTLLGVVQLVFSLVVLWAAVDLLRCRRWARAFLEATTWCALLPLLAGGIGWAVVWVAVWIEVGTGVAGLPLAAVAVAGAGAALVLTAVLTAPLAVVLWLLRHPDVRAAVA